LNVAQGMVWVSGQLTSKYHSKFSTNLVDLQITASALLYEFSV